MSIEKQLPLFEIAPIEQVQANLTTVGQFSDFIVFVDESGDHGMQSVDEAYPVFVLAFCIFHKRYYAESVIAAIEKFKFNHFGHDAVVLHENEIRRQTGDFKMLNQMKLRERFIGELTEIVDTYKFILIASVIDKKLLKLGIGEASNPYHLALGVCLDRLHDFLKEKNQLERQTHILVECRGKNEDKDLELEFRRFCDARQNTGKKMPFDVVFVDKKANSPGLQLADLVARPIGLNYVRPNQPNRTFGVLEKKFFCKGGREQLGVNYEGWGLNLTPQKNEKPR